MIQHRYSRIFPPKELVKYGWGEQQTHSHLIDALLKLNPEEVLHLYQHTTSKSERLDYLRTKGKQHVPALPIPRQRQTTNGFKIGLYILIIQCGMVQWGLAIPIFFKVGTKTSNTLSVTSFDSTNITSGRWFEIPSSWDAAIKSIASQERSVLGHPVFPSTLCSGVYPYVDLEDKDVMYGIIDSHAIYHWDRHLYANDSSLSGDWIDPISRTGFRGRLWLDDGGEEGSDSE